VADNHSVVLARRPDGNPQPDDFRVVKTAVPEPGAGQFLMKNRYVSLDAGFRNWMDEGAGDLVAPEYLLRGIEHVGPAFCDLFAGRNFGKTIVQLD